MIKILSLALFCFLISPRYSLGIFSLKAKNINELYLTYDTLLPINFGSEIQFQVFAVCKNNDTINVSHSKKLFVSGENIDVNNGKLQIIGSPNKISYDWIHLELSFQDKEIKNFHDSIKLNYLSYLFIDKSGHDGENGENGTENVSIFTFGNGWDGDDGENGSNGSKGSDLLCLLWKGPGDYYFLRVTDTNSQTSELYKISNPVQINIDISGGNGGHGGNGGKGENADDATEDRCAGNGGDGGNGGNGGNAGCPGSIKIIVHPNSKDLIKKINITTSGAIPGKAGKGGARGNGGARSVEYHAGERGRLGANGIKGSACINVTNQDFLIKAFEIPT